MNWKKKEKYKKHLKELEKSKNLKKVKLPKLSNKEKSVRLKQEQLKLKNKNEVIFKNILDEFNIDYIWQQPFYNGDRYVCVDFYFESTKIVVEIDGKEHYQSHNLKKDKIRTRYLKEVHGIKEVLRIDNMQLYYNKNDIIELLLDKLE